MRLWPERGYLVLFADLKARWLTIWDFETALGKDREARARLGWPNPEDARPNVP
jgi:hypothetical protein